MNSKILLLLLVMLLPAGYLLHAQTWTGATGNNWNTATNWNTNAVPLATDNVTIPGTGITNWPQLSSDITVAGLNMNIGSQLDVNGFSVTASGNFSIDSAILNNSSSTTDIVFNLPGNNESDFGGNLINDHISFNISGTAPFYEGYPTGNHFTGNATFNIGGTGTFYSAYSAACRYDGNLSITRTAGSSSTIFQNGASTVGGNFSFTGMGGTSNLGNSGNKTSIGGTVNITNSGTSNFTMYYLVNNTAGGSITLQNTGGTNIQNDTLLVSNVAISGLQNGCTFNYNKISGNITLADDAANATQIYFGGNYLGGNFTATVNGTEEFDEGYPAGNHFAGNATFNIGGTGNSYTAYSAASQYDGNLGITRTAAGSSTIFNSGNSTVGGNFSFSGVGGTVGLNAGNNKINIGGMINITNSGTNDITIYHLTNNTAGGSITLQNTGGTNIQNDTLLVSNVAISGLKNGMNFNYNKISGTCSFADDAANTAYINFGGNYLGGNFTATVNGTEEFDEGYPAGNHFTGNATFNVGGTGSFYTAYQTASQYDGNLGITRTAAGSSTVFSNGASTIGGSFSFTGVGGAANLGTVGNKTSISGTVNVVNSGTDAFYMYHLANNTAGGSITVQSTGQINISLDTLLVSTIAISGFKSGLILSNNNIIGNTTLADDAANAADVYVGGSYLGGNFAATINGNASFYEGYPVGNHFTGNATFNINGTGGFYSAYQTASQYDGNLSVNRTAAGACTIFRNGASTTGGNFSFSGVGGAANLGNLSNKTGIAGMVNISNSGADGFNLYGLANSTSGGTIIINTTGVVNVQSDTLLAAKVLLKGLSGIGGQSAIRYNSITADSINISDNTAATSETVDFGNNLFTGNFTATFQSAAPAYEGLGGSNHYVGNAAFNHSGSGILTLGYNNQYPQFDKDFSLNEATYNLTLIRGAVFGGTGNGHIIQSGAQAIVLQNGSINKTGGATLTLNDSVAVATNFDFVSGNIITSANKELIFGYGTTATNASTGSHVIGPVSKVGDNAFTFPIGTATSLNTAAISVPVPDTSFPFDNRFRAQYYQSNPAAAGYDTALHANTVVKISGCEYWDIQRVSGTNNVSVTLGFSNPCTNSGPGYISDPGKLRLMHWNGSLWEDLGNGGTTGTTTNGTLTTAAPVTNFSPFGIGTTDIGANPLPLGLISFTGTSQGKNNLLQWKTADEQNIRAYEVQRSSDGSSFNTIGEVVATGSGNNSYSFTDDHVAGNSSFYRLKLADRDGSFTYSNIIKLGNKSGNNFNVYPNPATGILHVITADMTSNIQVTDLTGRILITSVITNGQAAINISDLIPGTYYCKAGDKSILFVKE